jgi:DNA invertase Pin-like site-specific DNA recombinase
MLRFCVSVRHGYAVSGLPEEWVFEDEGHSGATLLRPGLERLRDLVASVGVDVVLVYAPDRLVRKFAYQALLIEEFARAGTRVEFVRGPRGDSPEDQLLVQFQGMFAEYEKAQLIERYRRARRSVPGRGRSTSSAVPRSATATCVRPRRPAPATRSPRPKRPWSPRCSAATPTRAPRSPA